MLNPTQKLTEMMATLNGQKIKGLEQTMTSATQELVARVQERGLEQQLSLRLDDDDTALQLLQSIEDGILGGADYPISEANDFMGTHLALEQARDDREEMIKALKVGAGVAVGATVTGLLWREANRRGWVARATRAIEARKIVASVKKRHGKVAALAAKLALAGKITGVHFPGGTASATVINVTRDGIAVNTAKASAWVIPYGTVVGIAKTRTITQSNESEGFNLLLEHSDE